MASAPQVVVTFLYPYVENSTFNMDYYLSHHLPTFKAAWTKHGMITCIVSELEPGSQYRVQIVTTWQDMDSWAAAQKDEATPGILADAANFTDVTASVLVSKVRG
jgi:hypothetical protein